MYQDTFKKEGPSSSDHDTTDSGKENAPEYVACLPLIRI